MRSSWTYQPPAPIRQFRVNDIVTIRVDEITRVMAEGSSESRKRTLYEAILTDWIRLQDFRLRPDPQGQRGSQLSPVSRTRIFALRRVLNRENP